MAKLKKSEAFTAETEREIQQVMQSVNELAQIMKDLSVLVIDQGTIVDRIVVTNVAASVEDGLKQLQKAERSRKQCGMVMCVTVLVIMCFVMLIHLILKEIIYKVISVVSFLFILYSSYSTGNCYMLKTSSHIITVKE